VSHVWTSEAKPNKTFKKNGAVSLKAPVDPNQREKEVFALLESKKKLSKFGAHGAGSDFCNGGYTNVVPHHKFLCWSSEEWYDQQPHGFGIFTGLTAACNGWGYGGFMVCWTARQPIPILNGQICGPGKNRVAMVRTQWVNIDTISRLNQC